MRFKVGFFYVVVYGFFWWFYLVGLTMGILVRLGLRHRLLWFWVFRWPRGVGMVRKWKWYLLTDFGSRRLHQKSRRF